MPSKKTAEKPLFGNEWIDSVAEFTETFIPEDVSTDKKRLEKLPPFDAAHLILLRLALVTEEVSELSAAMNAMVNELKLSNDERDKLFVMREYIERAKVKAQKAEPMEWPEAKRETLDGLADSIVVLIGTALAFGLDLNEAMKRVHRSNMSKMGPDGRPIYREDGKILKGPDFKPPVLDDLV